MTRTGIRAPSRGPGEVWRTISHCPEFAVSSFGRVKRIAGNSPEARPYVGKTKKLCANEQGYYIAALWSKGRTRTFLVNRLVCAAFHGPPPSRAHHAAHCNGDKTDNRSDNLRWATPRENSDDKETHGTVRRGESHPYAKLTDADVAEIRRARRGECAGLATKFGVERTHISRLRNRKLHHWAHVPFPEADRGL